MMGCVHTGRFDTDKVVFCGPFTSKVGTKRLK